MRKKATVKSSGQIDPGDFLFYIIYITTNSYFLEPSPIFSAWSKQLLHSDSGVELQKWSWWSTKPFFAMFFASWLPGIGAALRQASTQAWSSASGSKEANIPIFGRIGTSFSPWQSQLGDTSTIREIWKFGRPSTTALVYSAIRQFNSSFAVSLSKAMASKLQAPRQRPQPTQCSPIHAFSGSFIKDQTTVGTFFLTFAAAFT